jgi:hypothetical protein
MTTTPKPSPEATTAPEGVCKSWARRALAAEERARGWEVEAHKAWAALSAALEQPTSEPAAAPPPTENPRRLFRLCPAVEHPMAGSYCATTPNAECDGCDSPLWPAGVVNDEEPDATPPPDLAPTGAESAPAPAIPTKPMAKAGDAIKQGDGPGYDTLADRGVQESAVPPAELADAAMLVRRWAPAIAAQIDALIREWPAVPARAEVPRCPHGAPIHACDAPSAAPAQGERPESALRVQELEAEVERLTEKCRAISERALDWETRCAAALPAGERRAVLGEAERYVRAQVGTFQGVSGPVKMVDSALRVVADGLRVLAAAPAQKPEE